MDSIAKEALRRLSEFTTQNLSNTSWAYSALGCLNVPLLDALAAQAINTMDSLCDRDIAAIAWAFATLGLRNLPLLDAIASAARRTMDEFQSRCLANTSWAFATVQYGDFPLFNAISAAALRKIRGAVPETLEDSALDDFTTNIKALGWALNFSGFLTDRLDEDMRATLWSLAEVRDLRLVKRISDHPPPQPSPLPPRDVFIAESADPDVPPQILIDLEDVCVVHKPPGWEVDCADVGTGILLSTFLQQTFTPLEAPLVHYEEYQFGMVHRLDRVSSGLLLVGKTFVGYHSLNWQLNTGRLQREYMVLVHGWVNPSLRCIDAKVLHIHAEGYKESRVNEQGKPAKTYLTTLGHYTLDGFEEEQLSIVVIQICTGRRHQIRTHLCHVGHPTVTDGKYMTREQFVRDKQWCERNFLHRYRLGFHDSSGNPHASTAALPADLRAALSYLVPADEASAAALKEWCDGVEPKAWQVYTGLSENSRAVE